MATVSRALNGSGYVRHELKQRIVDTARELDYQPNFLARGLTSKHSYTIGLVLPDITNPFFPAVARGVEDVAHRNGYNVVLCNTDGDARKEADYLKVLRSKQVDGVIFTTSQSSTRHVKHLIELGIPVVLADRRMKLECDFVAVDNVEGAYMAARHLIALGHRRIGFITGPQDVATGSERIAGYRKAMEEAGLEIDDGLILKGDYRQHSGYQGAKSLLRKSEPPTAIFACNDLMAIGVLMALEEEGLRVPDDMAVVGYDDTLLASVCRPRLTSVAQPKYEIGAIACEMLLNRIKVRDKPREQTILRPQLIIRDSSVVGLKSGKGTEEG